jgi:hypothetical protein
MIRDGKVTGEIRVRGNANFTISHIILASLSVAEPFGRLVIRGRENALLCSKCEVHSCERRCFLHT